MPNSIPASSLIIDDTLFASLTDYAKQANEETVSLFEEILGFKNNVLQTGLAELNKLLGQATISELDKRRITNRFSRLINNLDRLLDLSKDYTLARDVQEEVLMTLTYVRELLKQKQAQVFYQPAAGPQTLSANQQVLLQDAPAKALYEQTLKTIKDQYHKLGYNYTCFISYAWPLAKDPSQAKVQQLTQQDESWIQDFLKQLRQDLRQAGIHALLDIVDNEAGNNIYQFMTRANSSDYVILIGTESLLKKHKNGLTAVCNELIEIKRKRRADKTQGLPPRVYPLLLSGNVEHSFPPEYELYSTIREWQKKTYVTNVKELIRTIYGASQDNRDYKNLWQAFTSQYQHHLSTQDTAAYYQFPAQAIAKLPFYHNLPERNTHFVGRDSLLKQLEIQLQNAPAGGILFAIQGLGGIGKTQLALEYAHLQLTRQHYNFIWWLDATNIATGYLALADYFAIAQELKSEERIAAAKRQLSAQERWLLIFDNAPSYNSIQAHLPSTSGQVLVTSRHTEDWSYALTLDSLTREASIALLAELLESKPEKQDSTFKQSADELANLLGDLPAALAQASAYIKKTGSSIAGYIKLFNTQRQALWQEEKPAKDYLAKVPQTWEPSFEAARTQMEEKVSLFDTVIGHFAYLLSPVPRWLLATLTADTLAFNKLLRASKAHALITGSDTLSMHPLVQQSIRDKGFITLLQVATWLSQVKPQDRTQQQALRHQLELLLQQIKTLSQQHTIDEFRKAKELVQYTLAQQGMQLSLQGLFAHTAVKPSNATLSNEQTSYNLLYPS